MTDHFARPDTRAGVTDRTRCTICGKPIERTSGSGTKRPGMGATFRHRRMSEDERRAANEQWSDAFLRSTLDR